MKRRTGYVLVMAFLTVSAVAEAKKKPVEKGITPGELGYVDSAATVYYYTTGLVRELVNGDAQAAFDMYNEAVKLDSMYAPGYYQLANILAMADLPEALRYSEKANAIDSANVWYKAQLGRLTILNEDYARAKEIYNELIRMAPNNADNYRLLAALYDETGQPFTALAMLDSAEYKLGRSEDMSAYRRELLMKVKNYDKAVDETESLIAEFPYKPENYVYLGKIYVAMNKDSLARANFIKAAEIAPGDVGVLSELNEYYRLKGDIVHFLSTARTLFMSDDIPLQGKLGFYEDIARDRDFYRENFYQIRDLASILLIKYPDSEEVLDNYARTLYATGEPEEALALYKARLSDTAGINIYNNILDLESYLKRPDSVVLYSEKALRRFPCNVDIYMRQSASMSYLEEYDQALNSLRAGLGHARTDSLRSVVYGMMGDTYHQQGKSKQSYENYRKALRYWPDNIMVLNNYSYYLSEEGRDLERALAMSERANALEPGVATYIDTYGWILYKLGRYEEAKKYVQQAISFDRSGSDVLFEHYGDILYALNDYFMASFYWRKALEAGADPQRMGEKLKLVEGK